jgi:dnd system-associated protein 4
LEKYEGLVRQLAETAHPSSKRAIFATMRELLCFAAVLGFSEGRRTPLDGPTNEIDGRIFENSPQAVDLIYLLALVTAKDPSILQTEREEDTCCVFEEYATTGLAALDRWMKEKPDDPYGDQAILSALRRGGFLPKADATVDEIIDTVQF